MEWWRRRLRPCSTGWKASSSEKDNKSVMWLIDIDLGIILNLLTSHGTQFVWFIDITIGISQASGSAIRWLGLAIHQQYSQSKSNLHIDKPYSTKIYALTALLPTAKVVILLVLLSFILLTSITTAGDHPPKPELAPLAPSHPINTLCHTLYLHLTRYLHPPPQLPFAIDYPAGSSLYRTTTQPTSPP